MSTIRYELEPFASTGREAAQIVDTLLEALVASLRRDQRFAALQPSEFDLLLADSRRDLEQRLFDKLRDRVRLDDVDLVVGAESEP